MRYIKHSQVFGEQEWSSINKKFRFINKMFIVVMVFVGFGALKCVSMSTQQCKVRPIMVNFNSNEPLFYPYSVYVNKCSGSCNEINNLYAKLCVPDVVKDINIIAFNLLPKTNMLLKTQILKYLICCQRLMKRVICLDMRIVLVNVD